jgi:hypothetical protein
VRRIHGDEDTCRRESEHPIHLHVLAVGSERKIQSQGTAWWPYLYYRYGLGVRPASPENVR